VSVNFHKRLSGLYYGWRMIGLVSALRILVGGLLIKPWAALRSGQA
jgi:hypothetical protein